MCGHLLHKYQDMAGGGCGLGTEITSGFKEKKIHWVKPERMKLWKFLDSLPGSAGGTIPSAWYIAKWVSVDPLLRS